MIKQNRVFAIGRPCQSSLMFPGKKGAPTNIRLGFKGLLPISTIVIYEEKSVMALAPDLIDWN